MKRRLAVSAIITAAVIAALAAYSGFRQAGVTTHEEIRPPDADPLR